MSALLGYEGRKLLYCTDFIYIYNQEFSNSPYAPDIPPKYKTELCLIFNGDIACLMNIVCSAIAFPATNETPEIRGQISFSYKYGPE